MVEIVQEGHKALRQIAKEVPIEDITKPEIQKVLSDMSDALDSQFDGVAIAAPQIGKSLRIFLVSHKVFDRQFMEADYQKMKKNNFPKKSDNKVFINPVFLKISKDKKLMSEGCLSVRPLYGKVRRATRATIEAYDQTGKKFKMEGSGLLAHIFQHETDHLEGVLFIDKAKDIEHINYE